MDVVNVEPDFSDLGMPPQKTESYREHKRKEFEYLKAHREELTAPKNTTDLDRIQRRIADMFSKKYETDPCFANIREEIKKYMEFNYGNAKFDLNVYHCAYHFAAWMKEQLLNNK
jgi:hypothetical protein